MVNDLPDPILGLVQGLRFFHPDHEMIPLITYMLAIVETSFISLDCAFTTCSLILHHGSLSCFVCLK